MATGPKKGRPSPADLAGDSWPNPRRSHPRHVQVAAFMARELRSAMDEQGLSLRAVEAATGVDHDTVRRILKGFVWPDTWTIAHLEEGLSIALWPPPHH